VCDHAPSPRFPKPTVIWVLYNGTESQEQEPFNNDAAAKKVLKGKPRRTGLLSFEARPIQAHRLEVGQHHVYCCGPET